MADEPLTTSVVIITRDRPAGLARVLTSLTRQSRPPDEVIVVDNAPRLPCADVVAAFADRLPVRRVQEDTPGIPAARNRGVREARQALILFIDDDCEADPRWIHELIRPFARDPHIGGVGGGTCSPPEPANLIEAFYAEELGPGRSMHSVFGTSR